MAANYPGSIVWPTNRSSLLNRFKASFTVTITNRITIRYMYVINSTIPVDLPWGLVCGVFDSISLGLVYTMFMSVIKFSI